MAVHANYLINLASADPVIRSLSVAALREEFKRSRLLGADFVVLHPGSAREGERRQACRTMLDSLARSADGLDPGGVALLLENTAGQGATLGAELEELAELAAGAARVLPAGVCLDTAHLFAAGYAIDTARGFRDTMRRIESTVGLRNVLLIHANDSKAPFGSRVDRHEHIGRGGIGLEGFRRIVRSPRLRRVPFICETPIEAPGDDRRNLRAIRKLAGLNQTRG